MFESVYATQILFTLYAQIKIQVQQRMTGELFTNQKYVSVAYTEKNNKYNLLNFCFASFCTNIFQVNFTQMEIK